MSAPSRHVASVLRQPTLLAQARVPGLATAPADPLLQPQPGAEAAAPDAGTAAAANAANVAAIDAAAREAEIERRAAQLADALLRERRDAVLAAAHEEGYARGAESAREAVQREWSALAVRAQTTLDELRATMTRQSEASAELALQLTFAALGKLLGTALVSRDGVQGAIAQALAQADAQRVIAIRVAPQDLALLGGTAQASGLLSGLPRDVTIEADERVTLGGCLVETTHGTLDARIETQLDMLLQVLRDARAVSSASSATAAASAR
ncbi:FliH/SctL family protein [Paraburkholderia ferrariae]|uniref:Flagellar assembly protein FliH n=1 Tax=Paraburkholderia ferrariae TaxID=386056 RepID=A0ABU9RN29_9BURK